MKNLYKISNLIRFKMIEASHRSHIPHLASSLSCVDIIIYLYEVVLNIKNFSDINRDRFILSKGHAANAIYSVLNYKKIIKDKDFRKYAKFGSKLEEHPSQKIKGIEAATGSLGHGLPIACGLALSSKLKKINNKTFVLIGDGECNEGTIWESALFATSKHLDNLYVYLDHNKWQATGRNKDIIGLSSLSSKFKAFGWNVFEIDGNSYKELDLSFKKALNFNKKKPTLFMCNTIKGKGVSFMEDDNNWHYKIPSVEDLKKAKKELHIK